MYSSKAVQNRVKLEVFEQLQVDKRYAGQGNEPCFSFKVVADMFSEVFKKVLSYPSYPKSQWP